MNQQQDNPESNPAGRKTGADFSSFTASDFRRFLDLVPVPAFVADLEYNLVYANQAACLFLGCDRWEELAALKITDLLRPEDATRLGVVKQKAIRGQEATSDWEFRRQGGDTAWGEVSWRVMPDRYLLAFITDLTERKRAEKIRLEAGERRWQSQKIEALGTLAGGIAHDFNNFLAVIRLHTDMLNLQVPADSPLRHRIEEIREVTSSAAAIVRQLMAFGRKQPMLAAPVVLNRVVEEFSKLLPSLIGDEIEVRLELDPRLGLCFVDQNHIIQVLANLVVSARNAMSAGGSLKIETSNVVLEKNSIRHRSQPVGSYVQIRVSDNGAGIEPKDIEHIFEPFYTTGESNKGAGLGLAAVYGIVKQSKGFIWAESEPGRGTTFVIQFPRLDQPVRPDVTEAKEAAMPAGSETVLLVEDEEPVRRIVLEILRSLGYRVFEMKNGMEALEFVQSFNEPIDLVLTDLAMPQVSGRQVAGKITALHPETCVLFMSGNTTDVDALKDAADQDYHFIAKPFSPPALALKVREILDDRRKRPE